jgi:hypothetical protein
MVTAIVEIVSPQIHKTFAEASSKISRDNLNLRDQPFHLSVRVSPTEKLTLQIK